MIIHPRPPVRAVRIMDVAFVVSSGFVGWIIGIENVTSLGIPSGIPPRT